MTFEMRAILESKRVLRQRLAAMPVAEKLRLLDVLRRRSLELAAARERLGGRRSGEPGP